ncbi:Calcium-binding mitochondrial carrier protein [Wickerhamomyces ciferrii]|uniref:Calcium-binding mitochondrial carrier protein n=1 Tax=Wickerhamomyces ciferrii (strain ATCC 14091 / BCRC 22168 / CBS 111 / JCM 3599 / NBRC 0793 / NRRL Y-1031 F-60-10) TaxID=1206466 RepID=K0KJ96_WICCF|nr:Calcium-binding mitochondrial carrier protein [Wickerhamomyces ciferrii]CCH43051.1 Calcium-binding mitochondrial carrier protein [Wickerhamomyces ciferrii]
MADRLDADPVAHALAGGIGGALSMAVTYPLVTLSTLAQTKSSKTQDNSNDDGANEKKGKVSTLNAAKYLWKNEGFKGFYSGLESAIFGISLNNLVYYYFYESITKTLLTSKASRSNGGSRGLSSFESIITGAIAGSITCISCNPIWVANTRMTVKNGDSGKNSNTLQTIIQIIQNDGIGTLFAGVLPALILVLNPIIQYTIFEQLKNFINKRRGGKGITSLHAFFIGALGKLLATGSTYPYITLKSRMHLKNDGEGNKEKTIIGLIKQIYSKEGLQGFYNGLNVKLSQSVLTAAFLFFFKEELTQVSIKLLRLIKSRKGSLKV